MASYDTPPSAMVGTSYRWFLLAAAALIALAGGVRNLYLEHFSMVDAFGQIATAYLLGLWVVFDAERRGRPIPILARQWFFLCPILTPFYAVWSRGWRGAALVAAIGVAWYGLTLAAMYVAFFAIRAIQG
jgi:hypothetical protein